MLGPDSRPHSVRGVEHTLVRFGRGQEHIRVPVHLDEFAEPDGSRASGLRCELKVILG
jgi:hypothetical protein